MPNLATIMSDHVTLATRCVDRLYVNGYLPRMQTPSQVRYFLGEHLGNPMPSPALFGPIRDRFARAVRRFAEREGVPMVRFKRGQRKDTLAAGYRARFKRSEGVVLIGVAQEKEWSFRGQKHKLPRGGLTFAFSRQAVYVNQYYFYVQDRAWGPSFLKIGSYAPYPVKLCLNGHEWVKQRLLEQDLAFEPLDNGFRWCEHPERLQEICDQLGPRDVQSFFDRWSRQLPWPLTSRDRSGGYEHRLSIWQIELSLTQVFDRPLQGRYFFEELIRENLDLGRPQRVSLVFPTRWVPQTPSPARGYRTRVITDGVSPSLHVDYKRSHVKQYFKESRALRTETTINDPRDFKVNKGIENLKHLRDLGQQVNRKLLEIERVGHNCSLTLPAFERLHRPTEEHGQRASAMRFGDPRVMALLQALCHFAHLPRGFRNRNLRPHVADLLGRPLEQYTPGQMTYDLRRLRLKGLITRIPRTHRYVVTTYGLRVALFFSKLYLRVLRPGWRTVAEAAHDVSRPLRQAFRRVEKEIARLYQNARFQPEPAKT